MHAEVTLSLVGSTDHLKIAWQTGETLLEQVPFRGEDPATTRYNVLVAVQEMLSNVYRHAYEGDEERWVGLRYLVNDGGFELELRDDGPPFDPTAIPDPAEYAFDEMPTEPGGYGIMIARMVVDSLEYERRDGLNVLRLVKSVHPAQVAQEL